MSDTILKIILVGFTLYVVGFTTLTYLDVRELERRSNEVTNVREA